MSLTVTILGCGSSGGVVTGLLVVSQSHNDDVVERGVRLTIPGPVEPVAVCLA